MTHTKQEILTLCQEIGDNLRKLHEIHDYFSDADMEICNKTFEIKDMNEEYDDKLTDFFMWLEQIEIKVDEIYKKVESMREEIPGQCLMEVVIN